MFAIVKRVFFFTLVNILVLVTLTITWSIVSQFFGIGSVGFNGIILWAVVMGMGGSVISLFMSKFMAKHMYGVQVIDPRASDPTLRQLVETVHGLARGAGLRGMPEVGIYDSPEVNAFATGPSKN